MRRITRQTTTFPDYWVYFKADSNRHLLYPQKADFQTIESILKLVNLPSAVWNEIHFQTIESILKREYKKKQHIS